MSIHIDSLVHTILHSKIYLENLGLRVLMVCESEFTVRKSTFPFLRWRIGINEIKQLLSLKTLTRGFRNCWLRKWGRKIEIFIYKMAGRFKMSNWNLRGKQYRVWNSVLESFLSHWVRMHVYNMRSFFCVLGNSTFMSQFTGLA